MKRLNGWQRIGVILSVLWCMGVVANASYKYYEAASSYAEMVQSCEEDKVSSPKKVGQYISECEALGVSVSELIKPTMPPLLPLLALLFLPVAAGWLAVYVISWTNEWIRDGFKSKPSPADGNLPTTIMSQAVDVINATPHTPSQIPAPHSAKLMSAIKRAWNGEERIKRVFWLYFILGSLIIRVINKAVLVMTSDIENNFPSLSLAIFAMYSIFVLTYFIWVTASLWRCAFNRTPDTGSKAEGYLVRAWMVLIGGGVIYGVLLGVINFHN